MQIKNVLATKSKTVIKMRPEQNLKEAIALLSQNDIGALAVVDATDHLVGILSERDIIRAVDRHENFPVLPIGDVMTRNPITGSPEDDLQSVERTMTERRFRHLPVVDQGTVVGMLSIRDLVKAQVDAYEGEIETLQTQLSRG